MGLMIAWETSNSAAWQHEHEYMIMTTRWDNYPLQVTSTYYIHHDGADSVSQQCKHWHPGHQRVNVSTLTLSHPAGESLRPQILTKMQHPNTAHPTITSKKQKPSLQQAHVVVATSHSRCFYYCLHEHVLLGPMCTDHMADMRQGTITMNTMSGLIATIDSNNKTHDTVIGIVIYVNMHAPTSVAL